MSSSHITWTYRLSRLDSWASRRPVSHYIGKYITESEIEHKKQELSFQGDLAHATKQNKNPTPFQTQVTGQHPNDTEQINTQHHTRNKGEPPDWVLPCIAPNSSNSQHIRQLNTQPNTSQASAATWTPQYRWISAQPLPIIAVEQGVAHN